MSSLEVNGEKDDNVDTNEDTVYAGSEDERMAANSNVDTDEDSIQWEGWHGEATIWIKDVIYQFLCI